MKRLLCMVTGHDFPDGDYFLVAQCRRCGKRWW